MELTGQFVFSVPQAAVWEVMQDPKALALIIPMAMNMRQSGEHVYQGALFFRVGSIAGTFHGKIELSNLLPPERYDIEVQGSSSVGHVNIKGGMYLVANGDEQTTIHYHGDINFGGRIASVGSRVLDMAVRTLIQQSFDQLNRYLSVKHKTSSQERPSI